MQIEKNKTPVEIIMSPINSFIAKETSGGIILIISTVLAMAWANSPWAPSYFHLWHTELSIGIGSSVLSYSLHHWINDGLMAVFFFVVGLEIKRELMVGELSSVKQASLPVAAALGGMVVPAAIYTIFNFGGSGSHGWGIPMATDIAFAIGILALLGSRVPLSLKIFLTALAIADDIGAVLVIAFFYTSEISLVSLGAAAVFLILLIVLNYIGVRNLILYTIVGIGLWLSFLFSGIHATVAGVILAFTIPAFSRINTKDFGERAARSIKEFENAGPAGDNVLSNEERLTAVQNLEESCEKIMTPLQRFEHALTPWISFFIIPLFALANAGVDVGGNFAESLTDTVSIGIIAGLFIGKQVGIFVFSWLAVNLGIAAKPEGIKWGQLYAVGILGGIGFTMSLFITNLAFDAPLLIDTAKIGILIASLVSGVMGYIILSFSGKSKSPQTGAAVD